MSNNLDVNEGNILVGLVKDPKKYKTSLFGAFRILPSNKKSFSDLSMVKRLLEVCSASFSSMGFVIVNSIGKQHA